MDQLNQDPSVVTPEEQNAEKEMTTEVTDEQLRAKVVEDYALEDNDDNKSFIEKILNERKEHHSKLSTAIKQKIDWRTKATSKPADDKGKGSLKPEDVEKMVEAKFADRELASLPYSDKVKTEIKEMAAFKHISIGEASKIPYITTMIADEVKEERLKNGSPKHTSTGGSVSVIDPSKPLNPNDFNMNTEEGRKEWKVARDARDKWRRDNNQ